MKKYCRLAFVWTAALCLLALVLPSALASAQASGKATIKRVAILGSEKGMELEITADQPVATDTRVLTGPDRVVIDFPGAVPGYQLKGFTVNDPTIKGVRVGLFASNPPTTRVVLDLNAPSQFQVLPSGNRVILKLGVSPTAAASTTSAGATAPSADPAGDPAPAVPPPPPVQVSFEHGLLSVEADHATLAEVLYEIHLRTGADIPIPAGAEQEKVIAKAGPGPAKEVMAALLNGSHFNFVVVGSAQDPSALRSVILTPKTGDVTPPIYQPPVQNVPSQVQPGAPNPEPSGMPPNPIPPDQNVPPEPPQ